MAIYSLHSTHSSTRHFEDAYLLVIAFDIVWYAWSTMTPNNRLSANLSGAAYRLDRADAIADAIYTMSQPAEQRAGILSGIASESGARYVAMVRRYVIEEVAS